MTRFILLLISLCIVYASSSAQDLSFLSTKLSDNGYYSLFKLELKNATDVPQGIVMASDFPKDRFSDGDTLVQQKWKIEKDTALFRFCYIADGLNCEFCKPKAIVLLPATARSFYLVVPNVAKINMLEIRNFPLSDYCFSAFEKETKEALWDEARKPKYIYYVLSK